MHTRFYLDISIANALVGVLGVGFLLIFSPLVIAGSTLKFILYLAALGVPLAFLWIGFAYGSYLTIEDTKLYGTFCFIRGKTTLLSDVVSIHRRYLFGGSMAEVYMKCKNKNGTLVERGLISKRSIKENDFKKLLKAIRSANPNIRIDPDLLDK